METGGQIRVLVVEDEVLAAEALRDCLADRGFSVLLAVDGLAALELASAAHYDVLLTDLRMPRMDGATLIRRLRKTRPDLPVVVMTGQAPPTWHSDLQRPGEGRIVLLQKPVTMRAITAGLLEVLGYPAEPPVPPPCPTSALSSGPIPAGR